MILSHIVAAAKNGTIGVEGQLPWDIPEDMKFFKDKTKGHCIIMGRKTFESLPFALPHRLNVVVTRQKNYGPEKAHVVGSIEEAIELCKNHLKEYGEEIFIIGGGEIYKQSLPIVDRIYLTRIHQDFTGDAKYPNIDEKDFELIEEKSRTEPLPFSFLTYVRREKKLGPNKA